MQDPTDEASGAQDQTERGRRVLAYHCRSKHHPNRYAPSPGRLDWANQPDPFRTYAGAPAVELPLLADAIAARYGDLYEPRAVRPRRAGLTTVAVLFELALGLSAWKEYRGQRWALRCNPSSGNLHPTEGYAVMPPLPGLPAGVYHYDSLHHRLERRCTLGEEAGVLPVERVEGGEIGLAVEAQPTGHLVVAEVVQEQGRPAEGGGRVADGGQGVSQVVLAVAVGALPVLPRLPPVD